MLEVEDQNLILKVRVGKKEVDRATLIPLDGNRFLIDRGGKVDTLTIFDDMGFFGHDSKG